MESMKLRHNNITLRAPEPEDIDLIYEWENNTEVWQVSNTHSPFSRFAIEQYVLSSSTDIFASRQLRLMIDLEGDKTKTIGTVEMFEFDPIHKRAGIGILIANEFRGKGYALDAISILETYSLDILKLHQLFCNISANNLISIKLFVKAGFTLSGTKKEWHLTQGKWIDELFFQKILKQDE